MTMTDQVDASMIPEDSSSLLNGEVAEIEVPSAVFCPKRLGSCRAIAVI